jgi:two-component system sensor histidine kinase KdpD
MPVRETAEQRRPSPDALLEVAGRAERSRLRIFMGAAPGVGKTYAMLEAARERLREGVDVVVGVVETHGRAETEALLDGLEIVPRRAIEYRGHTLHEMDLDAILARRPAIVLVDELAHTNVEGSRHPKRYSDVVELLDAGIDVYSTINIQHVESLNDVVAQITGVRVRETVPDGILERADEIKLVDLPPDDLIKRLEEGKVYLGTAAERALANYFTPGNLTALRELALRHAAERVDDEMQAYMRAHAVSGTWPVTERILVGVSDGPFAERLVRAARRLAARRRVQWLAVFVETAAFARRSEAAKERVAKTLRLAERLGGEPVTIAGERVADELVRYARERNVSEIVLGKPDRSWWRTLLSASPIRDLIDRSGDIDVRLITGEPGAHGEARSEPGRRAARVWSGRGYVLALGTVLAAGLAAQGLQVGAGLDDPAMVFLAGVLFVAVLGGLGPSILASFASLLVYDFFFVAPLFTLTVTKPQDVLSLVVFLLVAILTSQLTARARAQAALARHREQHTAALYAFARQIAGAVGLDDLLPIVVRQLGTLFGAQAVVLTQDAGRLGVRATEPAALAIGDSELAAATWVWDHDEPAGPGTQTLPSSEWCYVPARSARGMVGVLGLRRPAGGLTLDQRQLLDALADQVAIAIERTRIDVVLEEQAKTEAILEASEDGLIVLDPDGTIEHVNEVACAILEVGDADARGARFDDLATTHPHYLRLREAVREILAHPQRERDRVEITLFLRGRDHHYVLRPTRRHARDGSPAGLILTLQDVTYLRDQERRRENLVATLSHELRTPLTSLRMAVELLRRGAGVDATAEHQRLLDTAHEDVLRLQEVAQQFLDVARVRAMTIAVGRERVDVAALVDRVRALFTIQAEEKQVAITSTLAPGAILQGDETKLTWALSNLVANALRYTPRGGRIDVATATDGDVVRIAVHDTGPGIPVHQQERIFERFTQHHGTGEAGATGLGLAIVRDIVQAHGGRVYLESTPTTGTCFTLELPRS